MTLTRRASVLFLLTLLPAACSDDRIDVPKPDGGADAAPAADAGPDVLGPRLDDLKPNMVNVIKPGAPTICSRGTEYAYFVIPGARDKVIIEFEGGGACWDTKTCGFATSLFTEMVDIPKHMTDLTGSMTWYDHANPNHPMKDWTHVFIPYCTGDIHWGDNVKTYPPADATGMPITINHKGAINASAVLDWVYAQFPAPQKVFVTGCSAGGYGSILWAPHVQKHYTNSRVYHFSDSAAGIITADFFQQSFPSWNVKAHFPEFVAPFESVTSLTIMYKAIAAYYPNNIYSQYNTVLDSNQTFYYRAMGGTDAAEWSGKMKASIKEIQAAAPKFRAFIADGEQHCILPKMNFFQSEAGGTKLTDWLSKMVNDQPIDNAYCPGCAP
jgi:hypothetical protein